MGRLMWTGWMAIALSTVTSQIAQGQTELIVNGGFETGDLTGWTVICGRPVPDGWRFNDGTFLPAGPAQFEGTLPPISGNFDVVTNQTGPGSQCLLSDSFIVPVGFSQATLSFSDRLRNWIGSYVPGVQEFRVELLDAGLVPLAQIFVTTPADASQQLGPNHRVFDVTDLLHSVEGQEVHLMFTVEAQMFFFNVSLDDVSLQIVEEAPPPSVIVAEIDVQPGSEENAVNLKLHSKSKGKSPAAGGVLPVAVLSTADFDALEVDELSVQLGDPMLAAAAAPIRSAEEDVDGDGYLDLVLHFSVLDLVEAGAIDLNSEWLLLSGDTFDGLPFAGADQIWIVAGHAED